MRKILIAAAFVPLTLLLSCQDKGDTLQPAAAIPSPTDYVPGSAGETYDPVLEDFAKTLAMSMTDATMREFVHTEAAKAFDGDQDILVQNISQQTGKMAFEQMMKTATTHRSEPAARKTIFSLNEYTAKRPLLNIAVPVHNDDWNTAKYEPLVAVTPNVADEFKVKRIKAFDSKGQVHWLDGRKSPDQPVVVVGLNEQVRMDATGQMRVKTNLISVGKANRNTVPKDLPFMNNEELPYEDNGGGGSTGGGGTGGGGTTTCQFQDGARLSIPRLEINNVEPFESWDRGFPEICLESYGINPTTNTERKFRRFIGLAYNNAYRQPGPWSGYGYSPYKSIDMNHLETWHTNQFGNQLAFKFWEEDSGGTDASSTLTLGPVSITINFGAGDEEIGDLWLYRCGDRYLNQHNGQYFKELQSRGSNLWIFFQST